MLKRLIPYLLLTFIATTSSAFASPAFDAIVAAIQSRDYKMVNNMLLANSNNSLLTERDSGGRTILHYAANHGNTRILADILAYEPDVNALDNDGQSPIFYAVNNGYEDNTRMLIGAKANVNIANRTRFTPLLIAAQNGKPKLARILIGAGADVNVRSASGATPLIFAGAKGNSDLIETLLRNGADLRARDKLGNTALHYAAQNNRTKVVKDLLPLINKRNNAGMTPLDIAVQGGNKTINMATELLKNGAKTGK